jgi:hypothetical protein
MNFTRSSLRADAALIADRLAQTVSTCVAAHPVRLDWAAC